MTRRDTMIKKYGSEDAYLQHMRDIASKGGKKPRDNRPFAKDRELARRAGSLGRKKRHDR